MSDGNIQAARTKLGRAVQHLTAPRTGIYHDATVYAPSLYATLASDLAGTQGDSRTPAKSLPPLWIDACQLLYDIDSKVTTWCAKPGTTPQRLEMLDQKTWRPQDTKEVQEIARTVETWCDSINSLLDPESRKEITAPCPACGKRTVYHRDPAGEVVRQAALVLIANKGCTCLACDSHWSPDYYMHLARLLECDLPEGVLE